MDQDPEMQGTKPSKSTNEPKDNQATGAGHATLIETVTTETVDYPGGTVDAAHPLATEITTQTTTETTGRVDTAKPKKAHKGLIALVVTLLILIIAAVGAGVWYFVYYNNPNKVAYDAITKFIQQQTVVTDGTINGVVKVGSKDVALSATLSSKTNGSAGESTLAIKAHEATDNTLTDDDEPIAEHEYEVEFGTKIMEDGVVYLRIGNAIEAFDQFLGDMSVTVDELDDSTATIYNILEEIDGEWWRISAPDIIDAILGDSMLGENIKGGYTCLVDAAQANHRDQIINAYKNNQFLQLSRTSSSTPLEVSATSYTVTADYDKMSAFAGSLLDTDYTKDAEKCLSTYFNDIIAIDDTVPTASELKDAFSQVGALILNITDFTHELKSASVSYHYLEDEPDYYISGYFSFSHPAVSVSAPESYRSVDELVGLIFSAILNVNGIYTDTPESGELEYDEETGEWYYVNEDVDTGIE